MRACDQAKVMKTYLRALDRAKYLGYKTLEDCLIQRITSGEGVGNLSQKLGVSEHWLRPWLEKLSLRSTQQKKVRFWEARRIAERDLR